MRLETNIALDDMGEHLSPKYAPDIIAPVTIARFILPAFAITIIAIPIVLTVPKEVPKSRDTKETMKKV